MVDVCWSSGSWPGDLILGLGLLKFGPCRVKWSRQTSGSETWSRRIGRGLISSLPFGPWCLLALLEKSGQNFARPGLISFGKKHVRGGSC